MSGTPLAPCRLFRGWRHMLLAILLLATVMTFGSPPVRGQQAGIPKLTLAQLEGLIVHGVPDSTLSTQITRRGISFTPTPAILNALRAKGAGPLTLAAIEVQSQGGSAFGINNSQNLVAGIVTNMTTGMPATNDSVILLEMPGMQPVSYTSTGANGHYAIGRPKRGPYIVEVMHQGTAYYAAAPESAKEVNITIYDVAPKVSGVSIEADVFEVEAVNSVLKVDERYFVFNKSSPPMTHWSRHSFEIALPTDATIDGAAAQRPNGLPVSVRLDPDGPPGHYSFDFPILPDEGEKDTLFQISYTLPFPDKELTLHPQLLLFADNVAVLLPKSMGFTPGRGLNFAAVNEDPGVQTWLLKNVSPKTVLSFTVSGSGIIPRR